MSKKVKKRVVVKKQKLPYATFKFHTVDPNTTVQEPVAFQHGCKNMLMKPRYLKVNISWTVESVVDEVTLVTKEHLCFHPTTRVIFREYNPTINAELVRLLGNRTLIEGSAIVKIADEPGKAIEPVVSIDDSNFFNELAALLENTEVNSDD